MYAFQRAMDKAFEYANANPIESLTIGLEIAGLDVAIEQAGKFTYPVAVVQFADVDQVNQKMAALGFLEKPVDLSDAFLPER